MKIICTLGKISDKTSLLMQGEEILTHFQPIVPLLYPLKTSEKLGYSDVFWGYKSGTLVENGLMEQIRNYACLYGKNEKS